MDCLVEPDARTRPPRDNGDVDDAELPPRRETRDADKRSRNSAILSLVDLTRLITFRVSATAITRPSRRRRRKHTRLAF